MAIKAGRVGVDPSQVTLSGYIKGGGVSPEVLTKEEAQRIYQTIMGMSEYLKKVDANSLYQKISDMVNYQAKLVSGQNIKRINGENILGSGNITVLTRTLADGIYQTISGMSEYALKSEIPDMDDVLTVYDAPGYDDILTKTRAQQLYTYTAGDGIDVTNNIISNIILDASRKAAVRDVDLNDMTTAGIYYVIATDSTAAENYHYPSGANGLLIVARTSSSIIRQFFFRVGTVGSNEQYWYSREASGTNFGEWMLLYNSKTLKGGAGIEIANGVINDQFIYKPGDTITISTPSTAPICMGGYIGSSGTALNLTFSLGRGISATSISATTLRISVYNATDRLILANATNDLITGSVYSCTLTLNTETSTVAVHVVKNDGTTFGTNATSITGALTSGTFVFS